MDIAVAKARGKRGIIANCEACGAEVSKSKRFCGDTCRKRASRNSREKTRPYIDHLRVMGMIARLWPVFRSDDTPKRYALMVSKAMALEEVNAHLEPLTEGEFSRMLKDWEIMGPNADLTRLIKDRKRRA